MPWEIEGTYDVFRISEMDVVVVKRKIVLNEYSALCKGVSNRKADQNWTNFDSNALNCISFGKKMNN